jgi:uncharacterized membrane protein YgaE (UPF0421/DUF939 family)
MLLPASMTIWGASRMLDQPTWLTTSLYPALLRSLAFVGAAVVILLCYHAIGLSGDNWAITSVALVMQTQARASLRVAAIRVFINVISASVAVLALHWGGNTIPTFAVALLMVGLFCYLTKLDEGIRSAYICVVIIVGVDRLADISPPIDRMVAVTVGSILGIAVSWVLAKIDETMATPR